MKLTINTDKIAEIIKINSLMEDDDDTNRNRKEV